MAITARDRRRLWGKAGNRCAVCRCLLTRPGQSGAQETVIGEEAHIIGDRPGSARYRAQPPEERAAYENRILLCPNHHTEVDAQPEHWTVERLQELKERHEETMTRRTADARADGLEFDLPALIPLGPVIGGKPLLDIVGPADAYIFDHDAFENADEAAAGKDLLQSAHDWGEIFSALEPAGRVDAASSLSHSLQGTMAVDLLLYGDRIAVEARDGEQRFGMQLAALRLRRAANVAAEQHAAQKAGRRSSPLAGADAESIR